MLIISFEMKFESQLQLFKLLLVCLTHSELSPLTNFHNFSLSMVRQGLGLNPLTSAHNECVHSNTMASQQSTEVWIALMTWQNLMSSFIYGCLHKVTYLPAISHCTAWLVQDFQPCLSWRLSWQPEQETHYNCLI